MKKENGAENNNKKDTNLKKCWKNVKKWGMHGS